MKTLEAKILDATHLELSEPIALTPGQSIAISIPFDEVLEASAGVMEHESALDRCEAPGHSPPRRHRERAWQRTHPEEMLVYAGQWVVLEGEEVIAHGDDPIAIVEEARSQGIIVPYVFFVEDLRPDVFTIGL